jgi:hypothetical protein
VGEGAGVDFGFDVVHLSVPFGESSSDGVWLLAGLGATATFLGLRIRGLRGHWFGAQFIARSPFIGSLYWASCTGDGRHRDGRTAWNRRQGEKRSVGDGRRRRSTYAYQIR